MPNRLKSLVMESLQGVPYKATPDEAVETIFPYCANLAQLGSEMKTEDRPEGISAAQVSRLLSNKKRRLRDEQKEVFFLQVTTTTPMSENAFGDLLVLDRNDPPEIEQSESIEQSLKTLSNQVKDMNERQERMMNLATVQLRSMERIVDVVQFQSKALDNFQRQSKQIQDSLGNLSKLKEVADRISESVGEFLTEDEWEQAQADRHDWDDAND